jgi:hypothetical protein
VNEGDIEEPNWQTEFWGTKYPRLYQLRNQWDLEGVFYATTTPGTVDLEVIEYGTNMQAELKHV